MTTFAKQARSGSAARVMRAPQPPQPANGSVRACRPYAGELARHRVISADGFDYVVATAAEVARQQNAYVTGAYPVQRGYLVMLRQPLYEVRSADADTAREQHEMLVSVLAEAGVRVVRAKRILAARQRAERAEAMRGVKHTERAERGDERLEQPAVR